MKQSLVVFILPVLAYAATSTSLTSTSSLIDRRDFNQSEYDALPQCVAKCVHSVTSSSDCQPSDTTCFCARDNITATYSTCIESSCMMPADLLHGEKYLADTCNYPHRSRQSLHRGVLWGTFAVALLFFTFRILSRMPILEGSGYSWDDYVMIFTFAMDITIVVATELTLANGSGLDEWTLTPRQIARYMLWTYISEILYNTIIMTTKIAVVLLYLRIWSADRITRAFRVASWIIIIVLILSIIAFDLGLIFQCVPVSSTWNYIVGEKGKCLNLPALTYSYGAVSISYDVVIFFLPIHSLLKLNITWQRKVGVCAVFLVGFLVTIIAIVRLQYLVRFDSKINLTWVYQTISMWSIIEVNFSVVATCMPAAAGLLQRAWRYASGQSLSTSTGYVTRQTVFHSGTGTTLADSHASHDEKSHKDEESAHYTDLADAEAALAQGEVDGRLRQEIEGYAGEMVATSNSGEDPASAKDMLERNRPEGSTALVHHSHGRQGGQKLEIRHDPPSKPAEAQLQYRDDHDVLHEVTVTDVPKGRMPGIPVSTSSTRSPAKRRDLTGLKGVNVAEK